MKKSQNSTGSPVIDALIQFILQHSTGGIALAFSGGVDSGLLLYALIKAQEVEPFPLTAMIIQSDFTSKDDNEHAIATAEKFGVKYKILPFAPLSIPRVQANYPDRCYHCKVMMYQEIVDAAHQEKLNTIFDGSNVDDGMSYQSGWRALKEMRIISPLSELNITKSVVRYTAQELGLEFAQRPDTSCLASRFKPNVEITREKLQQVMEGEAFLKSILPENAILRLRVHNDIARIKVDPENFEYIINQRKRIIDLLTSIGFRYVTIDIAGY